ncbi:MAG: pantoate--beta-alanine ligase [Nitrosomonadaceae bacterium]
MEIITDITSLRLRLKSEHYVVFVPTMGNLHEGHLSLIQIAKQKSGCLVSSIFVNRLQFGQTSDFDQYPRTLTDDFKLLENYGVDVVFAPTEKDIYPVRQEFLIEPLPLANILEGEFRPGFFRGVATLVLKLFNLVQPQLAIFGKKDYQQLCIIREMVRQLNLPIEIDVGETVRTSDGLALSSRNRYLNSEERAEAARLFQVLSKIKQEIETGNRNFKKLQDAARETLVSRGWNVDYIALRQGDTLAPVQVNDRDQIVLGAAKLGTTRLIDNLEISAGI